MLGFFTYRPKYGREGTSGWQSIIKHNPWSKNYYFQVVFPEYLKSPHLTTTPEGQIKIYQLLWFSRFVYY